MITYDPLWKTLNDRNMSTYDLIYKYGLSANTIHRIKNGKAVTTNTLNELCFILKCSVSDLIEYLPLEDGAELWARRILASEGRKENP